MKQYDPALNPVIKRVLNTETGEIEWRAIPKYKHTWTKGIITCNMWIFSKAIEHARKLNQREALKRVTNNYGY